MAQKKEQVLPVKGVIFTMEEDVGFMVDCRLDRRQKLVNDGAQKTDFDLSGSEPDKDPKKS